VQNCCDSLAGFGFSFKIEFTLLGTLRKSKKHQLIWSLVAENQESPGFELLNFFLFFKMNDFKYVIG